MPQAIAAETKRLPSKSSAVAPPPGICYGRANSRTVLSLRNVSLWNLSTKITAQQTRVFKTARSIVLVWIVIQRTGHSRLDFTVCHFPTYPARASRVNWLSPGISLLQLELLGEFLPTQHRHRTEWRCCCCCWSHLQRFLEAAIGKPKPFLKTSLKCQEPVHPAGIYTWTPSFHTFSLGILHSCLCQLLRLQRKHRNSPWGDFSPIFQVDQF